MQQTINTVPKSPNERLADAIAAKLCGDQLIPSGKQTEVITKLAKGTATQGDWKMWLDLPLMKKEAGR